MDDDLYRKTGLHAEAWRETGKCVLYHMQGCLTTRSYIGSGRSDRRQDSRPRFTLDQLETLYDEVWEAEHEVGPRVELVEAFAPHAAKVAELEAKGDLANSLKQNRCTALTDLVRRFWGWEIGNWDERRRKCAASLRNGLESARAGATAAYRPT